MHSQSAAVAHFRQGQRRALKQASITTSYPSSSSDARGAPGATDDPSEPGPSTYSKLNRKDGKKGPPPRRTTALQFLEANLLYLVLGGLVLWVCGTFIGFHTRYDFKTLFAKECNKAFEDCPLLICMASLGRAALSVDMH